MQASKRWRGFRAVLCPVDFSDQSRLALRYAALVAQRTSATLTVTFVNDPLLVAAAAAALHDRGLARRSLVELHAFVNATLGRRTGHRLKASVSVGAPIVEIIKTAASRSSDLIVMGTHGLTGVQRAVVGSTTLGVLQRTDVPVLAVPREAFGHGDVPPHWPGERVIAAVQFTKAAHRDVQAAAEVARWFDASLLLVHAIEDLAPPGWFAADLSAHDRIRVGAAERQLDELAVVARRMVPTETRIVSGAAADQIAALAAETRSQLLITALHDRRTWFGSARGSISYHVLSHAVAPVLAHPAQWRPR